LVKIIQRIAALCAAYRTVGLASASTLALVVCLAATGVGRARADAGEGESERIPFDDVKILIEHNATDEDTGFQFFLDGEPWRRLVIQGPGGRSLAEFEAQGQLRTLGLTELFFETNEPPNDEVPIEELLALFPQGSYRFLGRSIDGAAMGGRARLTHVIPEGPEILAPGEGEVVDPNATVIRWEPVTQSITGGPVEIVGYEVIVTKPEDEPPAGFSTQVLSVHLSSAATSLTVPKEFLEPGTEYELEVLALEKGGNQTISASSFVTQ
jgi:hypothetical protein